MKNGAYKIAPDDVEALLKSWEGLNAGIMDLPLAGVAQLLQVESSGLRRPRYLQRLYGRFNRLRSQKELEFLMKGETWPLARWL